MLRAKAIIAVDNSGRHVFLKKSINLIDST